MVRMASDPYDALQDARSESRYEDDPQAEPTLEEVKEKVYACLIDESAGMSDKYIGGKR